MAWINMRIYVDNVNLSIRVRDKLVITEISVVYPLSLTMLIMYCISLFAGDKSFVYI